MALASLVRQSSIDSFRQNEFSGKSGQKKNQILNYVKSRKGWVTRLMISDYLGISTATVSGLVKPMIELGLLLETDERMPCPITGRRVHWVRFPDGQGDMFNG